MAYRVIILGSKGGLLFYDPETIQTEVDYVYTSTGYEAAAEFLTEPTDALVVDLSVFGKKHLKLLDLARERSVELLGMSVDGFSDGICADDLNGMRLGSPALIRENILDLARRKNTQTGLADPSVKLLPGKYASEAHVQKSEELTSEYWRENS